MDNNEQELKFNTVDLHRISLAPEEVLMVTVKSNEASQEDISRLSDLLKSVFPNNKVIILSTELGGSVEFSAIKDNQ